jgi:phenol hydroxylase P2 protein
MRNVSLTLMNNDSSRPIVEAIAADNPEAKVNEYPAMLKIDCPGRLVVRRSTVSARAGREFDLQQIHLNLVSLAGNVSEDDDSFVVAWK